MGKTQGRIRTAAWLAAALALLSGCATPWRCAGCEEGFFYRGKLEQVISAPMADTRQATIQAIEDLGLEIMDETSNDFEARMILRDADGESATVALEALGDAYTRVEARFGLDGDPERATAFMDRVKKHLRQ